MHPASRHTMNGAFRLLVTLLYGQYPHMEVLQRGVVQLRSVRKLARLLGTDSKTINRRLHYLEELGYIESLQYSPNRRSAQFRLREPSNIAYTQ